MELHPLIWGWKSDNENVHVDACGRVLTRKLSRQRSSWTCAFGSGEECPLSRSMMIKAKNILMKERIWINRAAIEFVFQPFIVTLALVAR